MGSSVAFGRWGCLRVGGARLAPLEELLRRAAHGHAPGGHRGRPTEGRQPGTPT